MTFSSKSLALSFAAAACLLASPLAHADETAFGPGAVITDYGVIADVETDFKIPKGAKFKVLYDTVETAEPGKVNKTLNTAARFLNMHHAAGVPTKNMKLAVVFHGKGSVDVANDARYGAAKDGAKNANAALIKALTENGVRVILCGQSAAYYGVDNKDLLPNVEMALSAMTAHAVLQQEGYTLNPF